MKELWERPNSWMRELTNSAKEGEKTQAALQAFHQKKKKKPRSLNNKNMLQAFKTVRYGPKKSEKPPFTPEVTIYLCL